MIRVAMHETAAGQNKLMRRSRELRPLPYRSIDASACRRKALSLRGRCRQHDVEFPLNILHKGTVIAAACPVCYPQYARA